MSKKSWTYEQLIDAVKNAKSYSEAARVLGLSVKGSGDIRRIKRYIQLAEIPVDHFTPNVRNIQRRNKYTHEELFVIQHNTFLVGGKTHKRYENALIELGVKYACAICGLEACWQNRPIKLQLDHINGNRYDYRQENLRFVCPNCHSQTETFVKGNKNR